MKLQFPVKPPYRISQYFGGNPSTYSQFNLKGHNGLDIAVPLGTPIFAAATGRVDRLEKKYEPFQWAANLGNYVRIVTNIDVNLRLETVYGHLHTVNVTVGQDVQAGQLIGHCDSTGFSTGNHLHFGVRELDMRNEVININNGFLGYVDPMPLFAEVDEKFPVDVYYGQERSLPREVKWHAINGLYARKTAILRGIPWDDTLTKIFVYGFWPLEWGLSQSDAIKYIVYNMTKIEYEKRLGSKIAEKP